jgi:hypothetical protein
VYSSHDCHCFPGIIQGVIFKKLENVEEDMARMERMNQELSEAKSVAETADKAKSTFIVSH